jgi:hypothetical protein
MTAGHSIFGKERQVEEAAAKLSVRKGKVFESPSKQK